MRAVAEGVETSIQADALAALGCELAQGFYFSRPLNPEAVADLLAGSRRLPADSPPASYLAEYNGRPDPSPEARPTRVRKD